MSKQSEAKLNQGYNENPIPRTCANCARYESESITHKHAFGEYTQEKNKRCGLGGFAVKKTATCMKWEEKSDRALRGVLSLPGVQAGVSRGESWVNTHNYRQTVDWSAA